jgi:hypothetical protein
VSIARLVLLLTILAGLASLAPAHAQQPAPGAANTAQPKMSGRVVTRKKLAECRQAARVAKLTYGKRRKFVRECVNAPS